MRTLLANTFPDRCLGMGGRGSAADLTVNIADMFPASRAQTTAARHVPVLRLSRGFGLVARALDQTARHAANDPHHRRDHQMTDILTFIADHSWLIGFAAAGIAFAVAVGVAVVAIMEKLK